MVGIWEVFIFFSFKKKVVSLKRVYFLFFFLFWVVTFKKKIVCEFKFFFFIFSFGKGFGQIQVLGNNAYRTTDFFWVMRVGQMLLHFSDSCVIQLFIYF